MNPKLCTFYAILSVGCTLTAMCLFPWAGDATSRMLWSCAADGSLRRAPRGTRGTITAEGIHRLRELGLPLPTEE